MAIFIVSCNHSNNIKDRNTKKNGYVTFAPVKSYAPNGYGLYDMSGNVWECCSDLYNADYYKTLQNATSVNPKYPKKAMIGRILCL